VLNYSTSLLEAIWENLKGFGRSFLLARQMSANVEVAKHLVESGEYRNYHEALYSLNKRAKEYFQDA
jgi:hypothetical protein|tara:strand:+ start:1056 stop:1256 length:201 start_codon:yes stop_codon:yes gene_type:complete